MAATYTFQPTCPTVAPIAGYTNSPINVESLLRNKVDIYSTLNNERSLINNTFVAPTQVPMINAQIPMINAQVPTPFAQIPTPYSATQVNEVQIARAFGAETGAQLVQIIAARLAPIAQPQLAQQIAAQWGAEICAQIAVQITLAPISMAQMTIPRYAAEQGAQLGAIVAQRLGCGPVETEQAARIGQQLFVDICQRIAVQVAARQQWTGVNPMTWGRPELFNNTWFNAPVHHDKLYNIAFRPSSEIALYTLSNPIRVIDTEGNRQLFLAFELKSYKPEEITVTLNKAERAVVIEAAHEIKDGKEHQISRKYSRKFVLPESLAKVDLSKVELKSYQSAEGYLVVEAALPKMTTEEIVKQCPAMSHMPYYGQPMTAFNGRLPAYHTELVNNVRPVTVKTA